jgi:hypothetical protein
VFHSLLLGWQRTECRFLEALPFLPKYASFSFLWFKEYGLCGNGSAYVLVQLFQKHAIAVNHSSTIAWQCRWRGRWIEGLER